MNDKKEKEKMAEHNIAGDDTIYTRSLALTLTAAVAGLPLLSLAGWLLGTPMLASYGSQFIPMAPSTAGCFILLAFRLFLLLRSQQGHVESRVPDLVSGLVAVYGFLVFFSSASGLSLNPDEFLFKETGTLGLYRLGRMSSVTGFIFILSGIALILISRGFSHQRCAKTLLVLADIMSFAVLMAGAVFTIGYAFDNPLFYGSTIIPLALPTAISFLFLGGSLVSVAALYHPLPGRWARSVKDMEIGRLLWLGLWMILALVLLLGVLAWRQTDLLWVNTETIYKHPLQVRRAVGALNADILGIRLESRNLLLADNDQDRQTARQNFEVYTADAERQFAMLFDRYLGPRTDIDAAHNAFVAWVALQEGKLISAQAVKNSEAMREISEHGSVGMQRTLLLDHIKKIDDFSINMGNELYQKSMEQKVLLNRQLVAVVVMILLLTLVISSFLLKIISSTF